MREPESAVSSQLYTSCALSVPTTEHGFNEWRGRLSTCPIWWQRAYRWLTERGVHRDDYDARERDGRRRAQYCEHELARVPRLTGEPWRRVITPSREHERGEVGVACARRGSL